MPAAREVRVERQGTVDQRHHGADVLAEIGQREGGIRQDARVVAGHFQGSPGEIDALQTVRLRIFAPTVKKQPKTADRGPGECGPVTRIARDRLLHKTERLRDLPCRRQDHRIGAQIEVVGGQIVGRAAGRTGGLGGLQCRLDDAGDARRHLVLKLEDIFERAVEAVGPEMRAGRRVDQLRGDAHPTAGLAHRAFEHIAHAELAPDLLHIDRLALVGEARIAGDDEEPADARERGDDLLDHAVDEIFLLRVAAHIGEGQHRDRRLVGERQRRWSWRRWALGGGRRREPGRPAPAGRCS